MMLNLFSKRQEGKFYMVTRQFMFGQFPIVRIRLKIDNIKNYTYLTEIKTYLVVVINKVVIVINKEKQKLF